MTERGAIEVFCRIQDCEDAYRADPQCDRNCHACEYDTTAEQVREARKLAISALRKQERDGWIPVGERLPEKEGRYLVTDGDYVWICDYSNDINPEGYYQDLVFSNGYAFGEMWDKLDNLEEVRAWREIPAPYTEKEA